MFIRRRSRNRTGNRKNRIGQAVFCGLRERRSAGSAGGAAVRRCRGLEPLLQPRAPALQPQPQPIHAGLPLTPSPTLITSFKMQSLVTKLGLNRISFLPNWLHTFLSLHRPFLFVPVRVQPEILHFNVSQRDFFTNTCLTHQNIRNMPIRCVLFGPYTSFVPKSESY